MFYCMSCKELHPETQGEYIFKTGFATVDGEKYNVGKCEKQVAYTEREAHTIK